MRDGTAPRILGWLTAPLSLAPRSPSSARLGLLFPQLLQLQLRLWRLLGRQRARAHVSAIFRLQALARAGRLCARRSVRRRGLRSRVFLVRTRFPAANVEAKGPGQFYECGL